MLIGEFGAAARDADPDVEPDTFLFYSETFTVADRVGAMPLLRFAAVADGGAQAEEMAGLAAMHELLRDCLAPGDWARFQKVASDNKVEAEELMQVCGAVYEAVSGRPTRRPSASVGGSLSGTASSKAPSSSEVFYDQEWKNTPFGRREMVLNPERYANVKPISEAGRDLAQLAG